MYKAHFLVDKVSEAVLLVKAEIDGHHFSLTAHPQRGPCLPCAPTSPFSIEAGTWLLPSTARTAVSELIKALLESDVSQEALRHEKRAKKENSMNESTGEQQQRIKGDHMQTG